MFKKLGYLFQVCRAYTILVSFYYLICSLYHRLYSLFTPAFNFVSTLLFYLLSALYLPLSGHSFVVGLCPVATFAAILRLRC